MKMSRVLVGTLLVLHLVLVPCNGDEGGFPFQFPYPSGNAEQPLNETNSNILREGFYNQSCPNAEQIVADTLAQIVKTNPKAVPILIRLQFHDCFVAGCDASILLDYALTGDKVEKSSMFNGLLLKGADLIDDIKSKLEEECPQTVSCADTLAFATNEAMALAGLPRRSPLGGRRDSLISLASIAEDNNLPLPNWSLDQMIQLFNNKGFSTEELVVLLGSHSVGSCHCDVFMERVFNFQNTGKPDPALTVEVIDELRNECRNAGTPQFRNPPVNFDETPTVLDNLFFKNMVDRQKTLLITDSHLITDPRTAPIVKQMADDPDLFQRKFAEAMLKLSSLNVLTGENGEVRKVCRSTNA
ncbi:hypothetical protein VNO77_40121 [Canavalia gladiata]|uniref:Peroxidase n=1 Tax=Canavalia gladiata TaxID=3824 RepID=A0AAN9K132_CANGL